MRKFIFIFIALIILMGCPPVNITIPEATTGPTEIPTPTPTPIPVDPANNPVIFALYDGDNLYYYDGVDISLAYNGWIRKAGFRKLSIENVLTYFDEFGNVVYTDWLSFTPDLIKAVPKPITAKSSIEYDDDTWMIEHYEPEEAYAMGGAYKDYSWVYFNGVPINEFFDPVNTWYPRDIIETANGLIIGIDDNQAYHNINGTEDIRRAYDDGIVIYNVDTVAREGYIADENGARFEEWGYNWFFGTRWQNADGTWYGSHGYEWSYTEGLKENCNVMWSMTDQTLYPVWFNLDWSEYASIIPAGVRQENGEKVIYWIEANYGTLFRQVPSINQIQYVSRIYIGEGTRLYGSNQVFKLKPNMNGKNIFFHHESNIKKHDIETGNTEIFSNEMELIKWK